MSRRKSLCCAEAAECVADPAELNTGPDRAGDRPSVVGGAMIESRLSSGTSSGMITLLVGNFDAACSRVIFLTALRVGACLLVAKTHCLHL